MGGSDRPELLGSSLIASRAQQGGSHGRHHHRKILTIEDIEAVARRGEKVELHPDALERIRTCRGFIEERIAAREIMYGVNTGIGEFSEVVLDDEQVSSSSAT